MEDIINSNKAITILGASLYNNSKTTGMMKYLKNPI